MTSHPGWGRGLYRGPARDGAGRGQLFQKGLEGIRWHFIHGDVDQTLVSREKQILQSPWGRLIGGGRPDAGGGHGIVRLRRLTVIIGHACSFGPFKGVVPL